jgi:hypothetical protein
VTTVTVLHVVPSLEALTEAFARRITPPLQPEDAATEAQAAVIGHVRNAFLWQQQYPIPAGTSAERAIVTLLDHAGEDVALASREAVGAFTLSSAKITATTDAAGTLNPLLLLAGDSPFEAALHAYDADELAALFSPDIYSEYPDAAVLVFQAERD